MKEATIHPGQRKFAASFGGKLTTARSKSGFTQEKLSELSSVGVSTIKRIEAGRAQPSLYVFYKLMSALTAEQQRALVAGAEQAFQTAQSDAE